MSAPDTDLERTDLAWDRSVLALGAVGLLLLKQVLPQVKADPWVGVIVLLLAGGFALAAYWYRRDRRRRTWVSRRSLAVVAGSTIGVGISLLALELWPR